MKKFIHFFHRTQKALIIALENVRKRYKTVELVASIVSGTYNGYFCVQGTGKRQLKYN